MPVTDPRVARSKATVMRTVTALLVEGGPAAVTIDEVVTRSGVARATVYRHWPTRRQLVFDGLAALVPEPPPAPAAGPIDERLPALLLSYARQLTDGSWPAVLPALLDGARRDPDLAAAMPGYVAGRRAPLTVLLGEAMANGEIPDTADLGPAMSVLAGPIFYRTMFSAEPVDTAFCRQLADDYLVALRQRARR
ncbi:TetR/AcrR family transcriptional regulator [Catenuloplanes japonicus]|uniref:TetR/AcrR family transcriptional regulator n=1 Tax=Catenuloplanes japonicus TaxID=33876 RepID=UPI00068ED6A7|nr:TetR/AcrR family transcriptional regulator [Catenuloplanes japonicus]